MYRPQAELWIKSYHFGFVYSCPPGKTLVRPISFTLSKMKRERRIRIFGAFGPDFKLFNTFFKMCAKISQVATKREKIITIENVWVFSVWLQFDKKIGLFNILNPGQRREGTSSNHKKSWKRSRFQCHEEKLEVPYRRCLEFRIFNGPIFLSNCNHT